MPLWHSTSLQYGKLAQSCIQSVRGTPREDHRHQSGDINIAKASLHRYGRTARKLKSENASRGIERYYQPAEQSQQPAGCIRTRWIYQRLLLITKGFQTASCLANVQPPKTIQGQPTTVYRFYFEHGWSSPQLRLRHPLNFSRLGRLAASHPDEPLLSRARLIVSVTEAATHTQLLTQLENSVHIMSEARAPVSL